MTVRSGHLNPQLHNPARRERGRDKPVRPVATWCCRASGAWSRQPSARCSCRNRPTRRGRNRGRWPISSETSPPRCGKRRAGLHDLPACALDSDLRHQPAGAPERGNQAAHERGGNLPQRSIHRAPGRRHHAGAERRVGTKPAPHAARRPEDPKRHCADSAARCGAECRASQLCPGCEATPRNGTRPALGVVPPAFDAVLQAVPALASGAREGP